MKYKNGDTVKFNNSRLKETECKCCGHIAEYWIDEVLMGKIVSYKLESLIRIDKSINEDIEILPNGDEIYRPVIQNIKVKNYGEKKDPVYKIKSSGELYSVHEDLIINKLSAKHL